MISPSLAWDQARLLPYAPEHDAQTIAWLNSEDLRATFGLSQPATCDSHRKWVEGAVDVLVWALSDGTGTHCGNVLVHVNLRHRSGYFQIYIGRAASRGQGLGRSALAAVLAHVFGAAGLHRVWLHTLPGNTAAEVLYRRAGFVAEGEERDAIWRDGKFASQTRWSILEPEWRRHGAAADR